MNAVVLTIFVIFNFFYLFFEMPVFSWGFTDWSPLAMIWGILLLVVPAVLLINKFRAYLRGTVLGELLEQHFGWVFQERNNVVDITNYQHNGNMSKRHKLLAVCGAALLVLGLVNLLILPLLTSLPLFYSKAYRNLLGDVKESSFSSDIEPINLAQIRIVDEETARKLAEKKIGEVPALGSQVQMGALALQNVKGGLYYIAPLEHRGLFQWISNRSPGSEGFVMVSATNPQDVRLIQDIHIKYQLRGFLFDYLPRYLYFKGIVTAGMADFSFEVDDELQPYWVVPLYKNKIGYGGADAVGVVTVNAQTGDIARYSLENIPAWLDRVQPEQLVFKQIRDWGEYVNGYWNSIFAKTGTLRPTNNELHLIYGNDDHVYWYTGITSLGRDESTVGFILVNSRTKEAKWYKVAGANEAGARKSAEGQVQEKGYRAGYPILYNINGIPTYIAPLKDKEGLLKAIASISVENYNLVGVGPDIESSLRAYQQSLANRGNMFIPGNEVARAELTGKISRLSQVVKGGESYFYLMLEGDPRIFIGTINTAPKLPLVKPGDVVKITVNNTHDETINIVGFQGENY
ncbi:hypothetical protein HSX37_08580|uniref:Uncharacterized protein n=1 Tax=Dendrosporobacter quercicolus TaxID=146817 RepID=A0A1G9Q1Q1_9FIRM|nr:hypothetical protein [Dendrosporobacter quercicolus]NSL48081.1 hypothetical protein [Dendrosporobacter quercicolus DSM 1736]SDM04661.1 hypothetical protein SAMN04488502_1025 [Dendrosporobacter quercicolus]